MILTQLRGLLIGVNNISSRSIHTSFVLSNSVKKSPLFVLRQRTGLAYNLCREALNKHNNDVDQAVAWLEAQAMALGLQKATKVKGRSAREGLIGIAIRRDKKLISTLELNCETDFVAKNLVFRDFALELMEKFAYTSESCIGHDIPNQTHVRELRPSESLLSQIEAEIPPLISKLGENIKVERPRHIASLDDFTHLYGHAHPKAVHYHVGEIELLLGRFGGLVGVVANDPKAGPPSDEVGKRLCQHVIGYNPKYIELPDIIREQLESIEKERQEIRSEDQIEEERDEFSDSEKTNTNETRRDEWPSMMDHTLIMSEDQSVEEYCSEMGIKLVYIHRIECGEDYQ